jgi:hypothetical protein
VISEIDAVIGPVSALYLSNFALEKSLAPTNTRLIFIDIKFCLIAVIAEVDTPLWIVE